MANEVYPISSYKEREVGVWLNNKPLYQMDIKIEQAPASPSFFDTGEILNQLENLTTIEGIGYSSKQNTYITFSNQTYSPKVTYDTDTRYLKIEFSTSSIGNFTNLTISLYYTKTLLRKLRTSSLVEESEEFHPVEDVWVNGLSVVDAARIAQIKSYKEVTQAQYNALPESKKSDGIMYCIIDSTTPEDKGVIDIQLNGESVVDSLGVANLTGLATAVDLAKKQNILVAGDNITLTNLGDGTVRISATGGGGGGTSGITEVTVNGTSVVDGSTAVITVPTMTSQLTNNSNFINKNVNDLTNYYTKNQTDNKIEEAIDNIPVVSTQENGLMTPALKELAENSVKDVKVNNASVVDENGIANISISGGSVYSAGEGIQISDNNQISAKRMTGATASQNGTAGIVPPPGTSHVDKFLRGDGTWADPAIDLSGKQDKLTTDDTITISEANIISANTMVGATDEADGQRGSVPRPSITDKNKFLRGDGTWAETGGGNVDDVLVNGQSVVDSNKIAQVTSYKELTQAEYDALPDSKLTDGILYCIKDTGIIEGEKFAPVIYSLEEKEIGIWTDGKPLYQKTIDCGALPDNASKTITHNISDLDIIIWSFGYAKSPINQTPIPFVNNTTVGSQVALIVDSTNITLRTDDNRSVYTGYVTLQYTKTTDTPGSGKWTTQGVPAHHYSTEEQVIGTWIDGKPLYEKTIDCGVLPNNTNTLTDTGVPNIKYVLSITGIAVSDTANVSLPIPSSTSSWVISVDYQKSINKIEIRTINDRSAYIGHVTIQYTKTTD